MKRGSSLRFIEWPRPETSALVLGDISRLLQLVGRELDGLDDVDVAGAAAEVPRDGLADLELAGLAVLLQQRAGGEHHARSAEAALQAVFLPEALLHRVQLAALLRPLDGGEAAPVG